MIPEYLLHRRYIPKDLQNYVLPEEVLYLEGNAIDLKNPSPSQSARYENSCFEFLAERSPDLLIIGPHLIDFMFGRSKMFSGLIRPDAFILERDDPSTLIGMAEFKSGKSCSITNKLEGFEVLMKKLRESKNIFAEMLYEAVGEHKETPSIIILPPDEDIEVTFISPSIQGAVYELAPAAFPVTYSRLPYHEAA